MLNILHLLLLFPPPFPPNQVVLNEVVIDRGTAPFLTNLEAFCDGSFVTHVQVSIGS